MAKKHHKLQPPQLPAGNEPAQPLYPAAPDSVSQTPTVTNRQVLVFWSVTAVMVITAWLLDYLLPGTPERVIERWLMLPFGLFLVFFLFRLK